MSLVVVKHPDTASSYNNIAGVYSSQGNYPKALELYQKALALKEEVLGDKHPFTAMSYHNIAALYLEQKYCNKAKNYAEKALLIYKNLDLRIEIHRTQQLLNSITRNIKKANKRPLQNGVEFV